MKNGFSNLKNSNTVPAVDKALSVVEFLCMQQRPVTQLEINRSAGLSATTGYRIVQSLIKHNWLQRNANNTYSLSIGMACILMRSQRNGSLFSSAQAVLDKLSETSRLSCKLSIRQWNEQVTVLRADSPEPFAVGGKSGDRFPVIEGSVGAVLLADEDDDEIRRLVESTGIDIAEKQHPSLLSERIAEVRRQGWLFNRGNSPWSRWRADALSAPVHDDTGRIAAALTLLGIQDDFTDAKQPWYLQLLENAVKEIESKF